MKDASEERVADAATEVERTSHSFLKMAFRRLLTRSPNASLTHMHEAEKYLKISQIQFQVVQKDGHEKGGDDEEDKQMVTK